MAGIILTSGFPMLPPIIKARLDKRIDKIERLRLEIGVDVYYPLAHVNTVTVRFGGKEYESPSLRKTESLLRYLKRTGA